jgi:hypothetical protein
MNIPDLINGCFEFGAAFAIGLTVLQLYRDKEVRGIHWLTVAFCLAWGVWNMYYYPHLGQLWSFGAGLAVLAVNVIRLWFMAVYIRRQKERI